MEPTQSLKSDKSASAIGSPDSTGPGDSAVDELVIDELLVEEISIDGMCGVY